MFLPLGHPFVVHVCIGLKLHRQSEGWFGPVHLIVMADVDAGAADALKEFYTHVKEATRDSEVERYASAEKGGSWSIMASISKRCGRLVQTLCTVGPAVHFVPRMIATC